MGASLGDISEIPHIEIKSYPADVGCTFADCEDAWLNFWCARDGFLHEVGAILIGHSSTGQFN